MVQVGCNVLPPQGTGLLRAGWPRKRPPEQSRRAALLPRGTEPSR